MHIRAEAADDFDHPSGQYLCINAAERTHLIQTQSMLNAQAQTGQVQFLLTDCRQRAACRDMWTANLAGLPVRRRHHHHLCTTGDRLRTGASRAKGFVVGVGKNAPRMRGAPSTHALFLFMADAPAVPVLGLPGLLQAAFLTALTGPLAEDGHNGGRTSSQGDYPGIHMHILW